MNTFNHPRSKETRRESSIRRMIAKIRRLRSGAAEESRVRENHDGFEGDAVWLICSASAIFAIHFSRRLVRRNTLSKWRRFAFIRVTPCAAHSHSPPLLSFPLHPPFSLPPLDIPFFLSFFFLSSLFLFCPLFLSLYPSLLVVHFSLGPLESKFIINQSANFCSVRTLGEFKGVRCKSGIR